MQALVLPVDAGSVRAYIYKGGCRGDVLKLGFLLIFAAVSRPALSHPVTPLS